MAREIFKKEIRKVFKSGQDIPHKPGLKGQIRVFILKYPIFSERIKLLVA